MAILDCKLASPLWAALVLTLLAACAGPDGGRPVRVGEPRPGGAGQDMVCSLPGWRTDRHAEILPALRWSCMVLRRRPPASLVVAAAQSGRVADWTRFCDAAAMLDGRDGATVRRFLERWLRVVPATAPPSAGTLTGYHEVMLTASETRSQRFAHPIYGPPKNPGAMPTRAQVARGALAGHEVLWLDNPVDGLWLELNGAGRATLPDGRRVMVEYAGRNGHPATFITTIMGRHDIAPAARLTRDIVRDWARRNPKTARRLIAQNQSMVFFRIREDSPDGPRGALGVPLTPGRSIAVDPGHVPLGTITWVEGGHVPALGEPFRRLMMAQDTGGAITGPHRGDVFFGQDPDDVASRFKISGRIIRLSPRPVPLPTDGCPQSPRHRLAQAGQGPAIRPE